MKTIIIGRGPSLKNKRLGKWIDSFKTVIRLSNGSYGKDHGTKIDYILTTYLEICSLRKLDLSNIKGLWFYETKGKIDVVDWKIFDEMICEITKYRGKITHVNNHVLNWLDRYKEIARPLYKRSPHVTYPTKGTAAALTAMELLNPKEMHLAGMDNIDAGKTTYHCHDFAAENKVLNEASEKHSTKLIYRRDR